MFIDPRQIVTSRATGNANMGDATDPHSACRWRIPGVIYVPVFIRVKFTAGTGTATLSVKKDVLSTDLDYYDFTLYEQASAGTDGEDNIYLSYVENELYTFPLMPDEDLVLEWTNPDSGTMRWAAEVGLIDAAQIRPG